jgi:F420-dependent oxidoreductase-like protein
MRIALMIEGQEGVTWSDWVALAEAAEDGGLDGLFRSDHYAGLSGDEQREATDAWAVLAALAAVTDRIRLGTLVSPVTFRHPSQLAKVVATVDHVADGRVELGMGAGWNQREHEAYGFDFPAVEERFALLEEQVEIVQRCFREERVTHEGARYRLDDVRPLPHPLQAPPPLIIGGSAKRRSAALAARYASEYNTVFASPDQVRERRARLDAACREVGRDPATLTMSLMTVTVVGTDEADLRRRIEGLLATQGASGDPDAFRERHAGHGLVGTVDEVRDRLADYRDAGITRVMCQHLAHRDVEMVHLLGRELVGAARGAAAS